MSWAVEVVADETGKWCGNGMRFPSKHKAEQYAEDLFMRWTAVREWRAIESDDPVTENKP